MQRALCHFMSLKLPGINRQYVLPPVKDGVNSIYDQSTDQLVTSRSSLMMVVVIPTETCRVFDQLFVFLKVVTHSFSYR
jgi:hypothetical protein